LTEKIWLIKQGNGSHGRVIDKYYHYIFKQNRFIKFKKAGGRAQLGSNGAPPGLPLSLFEV